jgi:hypothetical protein
MIGVAFGIEMAFQSAVEQAREKVEGLAILLFPSYESAVVVAFAMGFTLAPVIGEVAPIQGKVFGNEVFEERCLFLKNPIVFAIEFYCW